MELFMLNGSVVKAEGLVLRLHVVVHQTFYIHFCKQKSSAKSIHRNFTATIDDN